MGNCLAVVPLRRTNDGTISACSTIPTDAAAGRQKNPAAESGGCGVQIKLVISKQKLKEMAENGEVSLDVLIADLLKEESCRQRSLGWNNALESIPEGNDIFG
ncbi:hypothetical protein KSP39_PZI001565 [Platanthera zijinensis]|uniref:Uncharacterized protein n=1 Tax=Platanthera zijinensis TaxID=2320716 RepID=A0AAP0C101_9ASPA